MSNPVVGQSIYARVTFKDTDGQLVDPANIELVVRDPDGTTTTFNQADLTNVSTGVWQKEIELDTAGVWDWRYVGTTTEGDAVCEDTVCVDSSILVSA